MEKTSALAALAALAQDSRLDIFRLLVQAGPEGVAAGQIGERLGLPSATLSFHLNQLRQAELVSSRREGRSLIYSAAYPTMTALMNYLTENCCRGDDAACRPAIQQPCTREFDMKRLHVHLAVDDLVTSIQFYQTLFAAEPTVIKADYAKWMLDDPRVNFAISTRPAEKGLDHFGMQVETQEELQAVYGRLQQANGPVIEEGAAVCCYAKSEKAWIGDPQGLPWEVFLTSGESTVYGDGIDLGPVRIASSASGASGPVAEVCSAPKVEPGVDAVCCIAEESNHA